MAEVITLKKRLLGKEDINFDITGNDETENFFSAEGEQYKLTKLNASHIPLTANTREKTAAGNVDLALLNFANKIDNFVASDVLTENLTIIFEAEDSAETIQDKINLQKKNLNGYTLTFVFPAQLSQNLYSAFEWKDFYNGSIIITGGTASSKITIYDQVNTGSLFRFYRCQCEVIVQYFYFVHQYSQYAISAESTSALIVQGCNFSGIPNIDSYAVNKYVSNVVLTNCEFYEDMEYYPVEKQESATGKYIGEIFAYPAAEPPEGAYLLNGQTIYNCAELYPDFWDWMTTKVSAGYVRSVTALEYEQDIAQYGFCGAFVISENDVRLPLWKGYQTPLGDSVPVVGNGIALGFYDGSIHTGLISESVNQELGVLRPFSNVYGSDVGTSFSSGGSNNASGKAIGVTTDPEKSGLIADTSGHAKDGFHWCIQVFNAATELSTQESAQLASQMQMKAQKDLANTDSNIDFIVKHEEAADGSWWYDLYRSGRVVQGGYTPTNVGAAVVNFPIEFADTNYSIKLSLSGRTATGTDTGGADHHPAVSNYTTTSCRITQPSSTSCTCWEAKGYAAN